MDIKSNQHSRARDAQRPYWLALAVALTVLLAAGASAAGAAASTQPATDLIAEGIIHRGADCAGLVRLMVGKSTVITTRVPYKRVSIAAPEIADVNPISAQGVLLTAKKAGLTQLIIWDDNDRSQVVDVEVASNLQELSDQLKLLFPEGKIEVSLANGVLVLRGRVPSIQASEQAVQVATPYGTKVLNMLEISGGQQVMLQVRFAEVSRSATSSLGVNFGFTDGKMFFGNNTGQLNPLGIVAGSSPPVLSVPSPGSAVNLFGRGVGANIAFDYFIQALRQNNLLRTLADPNLTTMSGQEASFLAGGEFPIPIPQNSGSGTGGSTITVEYKEFGVYLKFTPVVLGNGKIRLKVTPEVSDLDFSSPIVNQGFVMPIINKRTVTTTVELAEGQTFALAGLLNNSIAAKADLIPGLGDLPVLGALFRSVRYQRKETELVVLVTPKLVEAVNPLQISTVPGEKWRHPTENELFWDRDLGGPAGDTKNAPTTQPASAGGNPPRFQGPFGFQPGAAQASVR